MGTLQLVVAVLVGGFLAFVVGLQLWVRLRARRQTGRPAPALPGVVGARVAAGKPALLYFHSPGCAACRILTPRLQSLSRTNPAVAVIDVSRSIDEARALGVLATPSLVEIADHKIVGYHVGNAPADVLARYAA